MVEIKAGNEVAAKGEEDIESMVKAIKEEERKRQEVREAACPPPSARSHFSLTARPHRQEIVIFGGQFYNGQTTEVKNDLYIYNMARSEWSCVASPSGPPPRSGQQAVAVEQLGGQLWMFGGEFTSASGSQFYHYRDLWCFHFPSLRWEKVVSGGGPSARSGHRMVQQGNRLVVFGGFHHNGRDTKYFNDVFTFDLEKRSWSKVMTLGTEPSPRSACHFFPTPNGSLVVFGGFCVEKGPEGLEKGQALEDMFLLSQEQQDDTAARWRWQPVSQRGVGRPSLRSGLASAVAGERVFMFGGVADEEAGEEGEMGESSFFNDMFSVTVEGDQATWRTVRLDSTGKGKKRRRVIEDGGQEDHDDEEDQEATISETLLEDFNKAKDVFLPSPRFNSGLVFQDGLLFLFGGQLEKGEEDITLGGFYCLDTEKLDTWDIIIEEDVGNMKGVAKVEEADKEMEMD